VDQVYGAIADPTRRAILSVLAAGEENVGGLADHFPISFNGVSKHVKVLERAGCSDGFKGGSIASGSGPSRYGRRRADWNTIEVDARVGGRFRIVMRHRRRGNEDYEHPINPRGLRGW
jgi:Helix-turn-helix domain